MKGYVVRWLLPEDALEVAALEARVHLPEHRLGAQTIEGQLAVTEWGGRNLSLGLYHRSAEDRETLVGFGLAFKVRARREMAEFFEAPVPADLDPDQSTIYVADWGVEPEHRRAAKLIAKRFIEIVSRDEELRELPLDAFATTEYESKWRARTTLAAGAGYRFAGAFPFQHRVLKQMFWLHFDRVPHTGARATARPERDGALRCRVITELRDWADLKLVWNRLLAASPDSTPWQSYAFLTLWWQYLADARPLRIFVVERGGQAVLALPMQISPWSPLPGVRVRMLEPIGMVMEVNRPRLGLGPFDEEAYRCALEAVWSRDDWDVVRVDEKPWHDPEMALLRDYGLEKLCVFRQVFSHLVPYLDLRQPWQTYLQTRSQKLRKNLKSARRKLEQRGPVRLERYEAEKDVLRGFEHVLAIHARSWKRKTKVEHSRSEGYPGFYEDWIRHTAASGQCHILVLFCGDVPVAATVAFTDGAVYYSAQIVHDKAFAECSPGTLLEAMELELLMTEGRFTTYEMLGSFLNNKMRWTDTATKSSQVLLMRKGLRTFLFDGYYFFLKPYIRPALLAVYRKFRPAKT
jgi:CelD/BcsL family acetyltransferase involved in cellulose biosynthesis